MLKRARWGRLAVSLVVSAGLFVGCPLRFYRATKVPPVTVVIGADCKPIGQDPVWIWHGYPSLPDEIDWHFVDPQWSAEIRGWPADFYTKKRDYEDPDDATMTADLLPDSHTISKGQSKKSGKAKKPKKVKIKGKSGKYWPVWEYQVTIWDESVKPKRQVCTTPDPGVCIRGGSGACEI